MVRETELTEEAFLRAEARGKAFVLFRHHHVNLRRRVSMNSFIIRLIIAILILGISLMLIPKGRPMSLPPTGKVVPIYFIHNDGQVIKR